MNASRVAILVGLGGVLAWACKDFVAPGVTAREARQVRLDSAQFAIPDGDTLRLHAAVLDQSDSMFATLPTGVTLTWSSSVPGVATVDANGLVTAVGPGQTQISATVSTAAGTFGASATGTVVQPLVRLIAVGGGGQQDTIGALLPESLVVQGLDSLGHGVPGVTIQFAAAAGTVSPTTVTTNATGVAATAWTLGTVPGAVTVTANSPQLLDSTVVFAAQTLPGAPLLTKVAGDNQTATVGAPLATPLLVMVGDRAGNVVAGDSVHWTIATGGGSDAPAKGVTDGTGHAQTSWTLGASVGAQTTTATAVGVTSPVTFSAIAGTGTPASIAVAAGNNQTAATGTAVPTAPAVIVKDGTGNPVSGVPVTFAVATGGGSVSGAAQTTGANGIATVGSWTLGLAAGPNTLTATATGSGIGGNPVTFTATATSGGGGGHLLTWVGGDAAGPTNWSDANNWSPAGVPGATDTTAIPAAASSPALTGRVAVARVRVAGGTLTLAGHTMAVTDSFTVSSGGFAVMTNPADSLVVAGSFTTSGGDETGKLTAGVLDVAGNLSQLPGFGGSFATSGTFKSVLTGAGPQTVLITYAGGNLGHFQELEISGTAPLTLSGAIPVQGNVTVLSPRPITGNDTLLVGGNLTTPSGSALTLAGLVIQGSLTVGGSYAVGVTNFAGTGQTVPVLPYGTLAATGPGAVVAGAINAGGNLLVKSLGTLTLGGRTVVAESVTVSAGSLTGGGHTLTVGGPLSVIGSGVLVMTNAQDSVIDHGDATFGGSDETGLLTAGVLTVDGDFSQPPAFSAMAFAASGTHKTVLTGSREQSVTFHYGNGPTSHFADLELAGSATISIAGRTPVLGSLLVGADRVTGTDTVLVGGAFTMASAQSNVALPGLVLQGSSTVTGGLYSVGVTNFAGTNQVIPTTTVLYDTLVVTGPGAVTANTGPVIANGALWVRGAGTLTLQGIMAVAQNVNVSAGTLTLDGHFLVAEDSLTVSGTGALVMTNPADSLTVFSTATFGGGDETGKLTAGALMVGGDFLQPPAFSGNAFATSGTFRTGLFGTTPQHIAITYVTQSTFENLDLSLAVGGVILMSDVMVRGELTDTVPAPGVITGNGHTLTTGAVRFSAGTLDHVLLRVNGTIPIAQLDGVTFQNYGAGDTQLGIVGTGTYTLNGLTFSTTPSTGFYVSANGAALNLTISSNLSPAAAAALTQLLNGATVTWQ